MTELRLTALDLDRLQTAQQILLSPLDGEDSAAWQLRANHAVRRFLGADHSVFSFPMEGAPGAVSDDTDPSFPGRLHSYCMGVFSGEYRFRDPFVQKAVAVRRHGGTGAYHQRMFCSEEEVQRSPAYHDLFRPTGLTHMIGMSTPMPLGEVTQFFAFEGAEGEEWSERALQQLRMLVPAFEAGVRIHRRLARRRGSLTTLLDRLGQALAVYSTAGVPLYMSGALQELLDAEPDVERLRHATDALARTLARRWTRHRKSAEELKPNQASRRIRAAGAEYRLLGSYLPEDVFGTDGVLVLVERLRPILPAEAQLRNRFGLTNREAEIALLLAEGLTDAAIAERLAISPHTARRHSESIMKKLKLSSRGAIALALLRDKNES
jgi:DNA-binding CsgD family transcriptional regulator